MGPSFVMSQELLMHWSSASMFHRCFCSVQLWLISILVVLGVEWVCRMQYACTRTAAVFHKCLPIRFPTIAYLSFSTVHQRHDDGTQLYQDPVCDTNCYRCKCLFDLQLAAWTGRSSLCTTADHPWAGPGPASLTD